MARRAAWVLNLDAELELAASHAYRATRAVAEFVAANRETARALLAPGDVVVDAGDRPLNGRDRVGRAWCPTPNALEILEAAGATPEPSPPLDVL